MYGISSCCGSAVISSFEGGCIISSSSGSKISLFYCPSSSSNRTGFVDLYLFITMRGHFLVAIEISLFYQLVFVLNHCGWRVSHLALAKVLLQDVDRLSKMSLMLCLRDQDANARGNSLFLSPPPYFFLKAISLMNLGKITNINKTYE